MSEPLKKSYVETLVDLISSLGEHLVLDTETSGLKGEILELTIIHYQINKPPEILLDTKLCPKKPIDPESIKVHHITEEDVIGKPTWLDIRPRVQEILRGKLVLTYNALFDRNAFHITDKVWGLPRFDWKTMRDPLVTTLTSVRWRCIMLATADLLTVSPKLKYFRLISASEILGIPTQDITLHSSRGDTLLAGRVMTFILNFFAGVSSIPLVPVSCSVPLRPTQDDSGQNHQNSILVLQNNHP